MGCLAICSATRCSAPAATLAKCLCQKLRECCRKNRHRNGRKPGPLLELRRTLSALKFLFFGSYLFIDGGIFRQGNEGLDRHVRRHVPLNERPVVTNLS